MTIQRKLGKSKTVLPLGLSDRSRWSYFMQGMNPDCDDSKMVDRYSQAYGSKHPAWLIASIPTRQITREGFKLLRESVMRMTQQQAATYLRVSVTTISAWETGKKKIPFSAYETLRLQSDHLCFRLSNALWDGWFICRKTGELVSPDVGKLAVKPQEINQLPRLYNMVELYRQKADRLEAELKAAHEENTRIRELFLSGGVTDELRSMQDRMTGLLSRIGTAHVMQFPKQAAESLKVAAS